MKGGERVLIPERFQVGDIVRIKDWDEMCVGHDHDTGYIDLPHYVFISDMRQYCGKEYKIESLRLIDADCAESPNGEVYRVTFVDHDEVAGDWTYTTDMIKLVYRPKPELAEDEVPDSELDLISILNSI